MKFYLLPLFAFLTICYTSAQDTTFYDAKNEKVKTIKNAIYFKLITFNKDSNTTTEAYYNRSRKLNSKKTIKKDSLSNRVESEIHYYENGNPEYFFTRVNKSLEGNSIYYNENGKISMIFEYEKDRLKKRRFFDKEGIEFPLTDEKIYLESDIIPEFPGGSKALVLYLDTNLKYPRESQGTSGRVLVSFVINKKGEVSEVGVVKGVDFFIENTAMLLVKNMPLWSPGLLNGEPVSVKFVVPIKFGLAAK